MKPHEETWKQDDEPTPEYVVRDDGSTVARVQRKEDRRFIIAAPEMARELLRTAVLPCEGHADCGGHVGGLCRPCGARAVLTKAGVLP